jgi:hypothetical protein
VTQVVIPLQKQYKSPIEYPELLEESNWNCGCPSGHSFTEEQKQKFTLEALQSYDGIESHFQGATAVVSCLGNRQAAIGGWEAHEGNAAVIQAMKKHGVKRLVVISSICIGPKFSLHWIAGAMKLVFWLQARPAHKDLIDLEKAVTEESADDLDYLLVRPYGIGEDVIPENKWLLQEQPKPYIKMHWNMAKLDVARFMVQEALSPTRHKVGVVIGAHLPEEDNK